MIGYPYYIPNKYISWYGLSKNINGIHIIDQYNPVYIYRICCLSKEYGISFQDLVEYY